MGRARSTTSVEVESAEPARNQARRATAIKERRDTAVPEGQRYVDIYNNDVGGCACVNTRTDGLGSGNLQLIYLR